MVDVLKNRSDITIVMVLFSTLALVGIAAGGYFVNDYARARASQSWPVVDGVILTQLAENDAARYAYSMDGRSYESSRERVFLAGFSNQSSGDYEAGQIVPVYVNPHDHSFSVLAPGGASIAFVICSIIAGAFVFFGVGGVVWAVSQQAARDFAFQPDPAAQNG
ncbi:MAG: DUF3592 domain-containing protein [Pseudomonadota bacterium]